MTDLETAIMIKNMARETVRQMTATAKKRIAEDATKNVMVKNADPKYTVIGGTVWYEDDDYKIPLETFRGKNKKFIQGAIEEEIKAGHPSAKSAIQRLGEYYKKRK